ncbi:MAG: hypothetical protein F4139_06285 [Gemmatimonadetes bacterium]|nr:hypothetical protein [Gemmatimonadota bacterium]MYH52544.1 hypothetical protein [Gemmatimonadota bacterium]MYK66278.1 hypothetical protein [Gemmatimonadota bacterium]
MIPLRISLDRDLYEQADRVSRRQGVSLADFCRRTLREALAGYPEDKPWMAYVGSLEGRANDSRTVDAVVYGHDAR